MRRLAAVILAAGKSTRMKSKYPKVLHDLMGRPVISYVIAAARGCKADSIVGVIGPAQEKLRAYLEGAKIGVAVQQEALGTGHAVSQAEAVLKGFEGDVLMLCGDVPLVQAESLKAFVKAIRAKRAKVGVLTMCPPDPDAYGRILRDADGMIVRIVEARDATEDERRVREVNSGIICADASFLFRALKKIGNDNAKGEYYLTDIVSIALREGAAVIAHRCEPAADFLGINTRVDLARVSELMRERINRRHMLAGVGILDDRHTYIEDEVKIGEDTIVMPHVFLRGKTKIGQDCVLENGAVLTNMTVGDGVRIKAYSVLEESVIEKSAQVGPFSRMRPGSKLGEEARIGNFVELKKCVMKKGAKANHLTYLGDATIGEKANIGCGTITCNYDGFAKYPTTIGDGAFVGSDVQFVAPVKVGRGAVIGAGSTITNDVPADALSLTRAQQQTVPGWAAKRRAAKKAKG